MTGRYRIKVIAFDLDDTLWENGPVIRNAEKVLGQWLEEEVPELRFTVESMRTLRHAVLADDASLADQVTELRRQVIKRAMTMSNISSSRAEHRSRSAIKVFLRARNEITFFPGAVSALGELARRFTLGALTNGNANINLLGLGDYFSFAFSAEDVGAAKPSARLFRKALSHTGTRPGEMIYVGDDPVMDVDAAKNTGLFTIWVDRNRKSGGETRPDEIITDITDLPLAVARIEDRLNSTSHG